jgi:MoaA/NifB/PqqE/SkfB family radical SAM enzyme
MEWEITTACNAACPQCPRNYYGGSTLPQLPIIKRNLSWSKKHLPVDFIKQLTRIDFCGTYGDPISNNHILDIIRWLKTINPELRITIKTNGSLRNTMWWQRLAGLLSDNDVVFFAIDGLADTNHIYRRKTNFNKIIENATTFIKHGGQAHWNFIVFKHNEHQVDAAQKFSQQLGFKEFHVKLTSRFFNKNHQLNPALTVFTKHGHPEYQIELPTDSKYINNSYSKIEFIKSYKQTKIFCNNRRLNKIYLSAEGLVFPCGWLHDRMYGYESEQHPDHKLLYQLFETAGGKYLADINYTDINGIIQGPWFNTLIASWDNPDQRLNRCEVICGNSINLIGDQNKLVNAF